MNSIRTAVLPPPNPAADLDPTPPRARAYALLDRARDKFSAPDGRQLAIGFGTQTIPVGLLAKELRDDPDRVEDFLRSKGVSLDTLNAVLAEALKDPQNKGCAIDLSTGSATSRAYGVDGVGDAMVVDHHLQDSKVLIAQADSKPHVADGISVSGSGFMKSDILTVLLAIVETLLKLVTFWQANTTTFEGKGIDDDKFRELGKSFAKEQPSVWQLIVSMPSGESTLRDHLRARKPDDVHFAQWNRAVELMITGAKAEIGALPEAQKMGTDVSVEQREIMLRTLQASGNTQDAADALVAISRAEPVSMRNAAIALLPQLPNAERANLLSLFVPPSEPGMDDTQASMRLWAMRQSFASGKSDEREALFETLRHAGFRTSLDSPELEPLQSAASVGAGIHDPSARARYFALLPRLGVSRAALAGMDSLGLCHRLSELEARGDTQGMAALLTQFESNMDSTSNLRMILAHGAGFVSLHEPSSKTLNASEQSLVLDTFRLRGIAFQAQKTDGTLVRIAAVDPPNAGEISLKRYFSDATYRRDFLLSLPAAPGATLEQRRTVFDRLLFSVAKSAKETQEEVRIETRKVRDEKASAVDDLYSKDAVVKTQAQATASVLFTEDKIVKAATRGLAGMTLDIRPGSSLHTLFALDAAIPRDPVVRMAASCFDASIGDFTLKLPHAGLVTLDEMKALFTQPDPQAAFKKRFPKLDFRDTVLAFSYFVAQNAVFEDAPIDLTRPSKDAMQQLIAARIGDGVDSGLSPKLSGFMRASFAANVDLAPSDPETTFTGAQVLAFSPVSRFQWSHMGPGGNTAALETVAIRANAKKTFEKPPLAWNMAPNTKDPRHAFNAIGMLEDRVAGKGEREDADLFGKASNFASLRPEQIHIMTITGPDKNASGRASFAADSKIFAATFHEQGGVPLSNIEPFVAPDVNDFIAAFEARIMSMKKNEAMVLHFSGHGSTAGMAFKGGPLGGAELTHLMKLADSQGVKLVLVSSACKSGERVAEARSIYIDRLSASGQLPEITRHLDTLRTNLIDYVDYGASLLKLPASSRPKSLPLPQEILRLAADAIGNKAGAREEIEALALSSRADYEALLAKADQATGGAAKALREQAGYAYATTMLLETAASLIDARVDLARVEPRSKRVTEILTHPLLRENGPMLMSKDKAFLFGTVGPLSDLITAEMNLHMPAIDLGRTGS